MKAQEVLRRYAAGERNFRNAALRGANFVGQDLSGADFSGADIRSANFRNATLRGANFTEAQAGLQRRWMAAQWLVIAVLAAVAGFLQAVAGALSSSFRFSLHFNSSLEQAIVAEVYLLAVAVIYISTSLQGFSIRALGSILIAGAVTVTVAVAFAFVGTFTSAVTAPVAVVSAVVGAVTVASAVVSAVAGAVTVASAVVSAVAFAGGYVGSAVVAVAGAGAGLLFSLSVGWRVLQEDEKFDLVRGFSLVLSAIGGTSFGGADLTGITFCQARLKSTNFADSRRRKTTLTHACWQGAGQLDRARLGSAILQDRRVRNLLTTPEKGYKQDLTNANFRGANLKSVTLEGAVLRRAILSDALLEKAVLKDAILTEAQAINTDFTDACLTGATLEA